MKSNSFPRVLVVTVNPFSNTSNNGKTYASFFKGYPKECLAQLYFHREIPTADVCENYFKISDEDIITNIFGKRKKMGKKVYRRDQEERVVPEVINNTLKKSSAIRFLRSVLWSFTNLEKEDLNSWLDDFKPEIIFFCGGDANYLYPKVLKISKKFNAKIVYYITDDYVLPYFSLNPFYLINRYWTTSVFKKMCKHSSLVLTIGDKMTHVYQDKFGIKSKKIMNLVESEDRLIEGPDFKKNNLKFVYTGGLHSNRWKSLALLGESFQRLAKKGINASLEIYSHNEPEQKILNAINNSHYSKFCGSLDENGVKKILRESDILVHVESFDKSSQRVTYLSVSTKIPEYMTTGKCILAIGPEHLASIEYIKETQSGFVISTTLEDVIDDNLRDIIQNPVKRNACIEKALFIVKENHEILRKRAEFQHDLKSI